MWALGAHCTAVGTHATRDERGSCRARGGAPSHNLGTLRAWRGGGRGKWGWQQRPDSRSAAHRTAPRGPPDCTSTSTTGHSYGPNVGKPCTLRVLCRRHMGHTWLRKLGLVSWKMNGVPGSPAQPHRPNPCPTPGAGAVVRWSDQTQKVPP